MDRNEVLELGEVYNRKLLDVGTGPLAIVAARQFGCKVTTVDISPSAVESGRKQAAEAGLQDYISCELADATDLPYQDKSFDIAISYGALHHVPKPRRKRFVTELFRVAKHRIIIADYRSAEFHRIHPSGDYSPVDMQQLYCHLSSIGITEVHSGKQMDVYICHCSR